MKIFFRQLAAAYGRLIVLLLLGAIFSGLTLRQQPATGAAAAGRLVRQLAAELPPSSRILIAVRPVPEERRFAAAVERAAAAAGLGVVATVAGEPRQLRQPARRPKPRAAPRCRS